MLPSLGGGGGAISMRGVDEISRGGGAPEHYDCVSIQCLRLRDSVHVYKMRLLFMCERCFVSNFISFFCAIPNIRRG